MPLQGSLIERLSQHLTVHLGRHVDVEQDIPVGGGSINEAYQLETNEGRFFVKVNSADRFPAMFEAEADGLERLRATNAIRVPQVIATGEDHDDTYLLLEHIEASARSANYWEDLGRSLAKLHRHTNDRFGLERNNYIGSLTQANDGLTSWSTFFIRCRLEPQVKLARDKQRIGMGDVLRFERLYGKAASLFPAEPPALLHGDLWSGNILIGPSGGPVLIDPAVYFGHREMDIAMTKLFGGFDEGFYRAYNDELSLESGWEERMELFNLYPLLVHVNLFGGGYIGQVQTVLKRFA